MGTEAAEGFTVLDWIGTMITGFGGVLLLSFPLLGEGFADVFRDMGTAHLSLLTKLATSIWFPILLGALVVTGAAAGLHAQGLQRRRTLIVAAFALACVGLALCLTGVYLPIFEIAGKIKSS